MSPFKLVNVEVTSGTGPAWERFGEVIEASANRAKIRVHRDRAPGATARLLAELPVTDLSVGDLPLESVIDRVYRDGVA